MKMLLVASLVTMSFAFAIPQANATGEALDKHRVAKIVAEAMCKAKFSRHTGANDISGTAQPKGTPVVIWIVRLTLAKVAIDLVDSVFDLVRENYDFVKSFISYEANRPSAREVFFSCKRKSLRKTQEGTEVTLHCSDRGHPEEGKVR